MKKLFFTLCALCLCGTMWAVSDRGDQYDTSRPTDESEIYVDQTTGLYFYVVDGDATITSISDNSETTPPRSTSGWTSGYTMQSLTIPETVQAEGGESYPVTKIGAYAFYNTSSIQGELVIPANIVSLGVSSFDSCTGITAVTLEYSETTLSELGNQNNGTSFYGCSGINTVTMNRNISVARGDSDGNHVYYISPFSYLTSIETIYIGENVTSIPYNTFYCGNTSSCKLSTVYCYATSMVPSLAYQAFGTHSDLTLYVYNELVTNFEGDTQTYSWPSFCSTIQGMGDMPTTLEEGTYKDVDTGLYFEIDEDTGVVSIYHDEAGIYTDANLVAHKTIADAYTLPESVNDGEGHSGNVSRIEASAFEGSSISGHLVIPAHIVNMGESAFYNCTGIEEVTYEYSETPLKEENDGIDGVNMTGGSFQGCSGVKTVNLYRDIEYLSTLQQPGAFVGTTSVATINIGPRVKKIPDYMFRNTTYAYNGGGPIKTINCYAVEPPALGLDPFARLGENTLNVPQGTADAYSSASVWSSQINGTATDNNYNVCTLQEMSDAFAITTHDNGEGTAYATFYNSAANVERFNGTLTAYEATTLENEGDLYIDIVEIGNVIPKATGVIVETADAGTYLAIATTEEAGSASANNHLYGFDKADTTVGPDEEVSYLYYLLSSSNGQVGFYWGADEGAAFTCQAHKAYLALPQSAVDDSEGISIRKGNGGEDTTGISSVESATEGTTVKGIYTIQGVRVSNMNQPGLYIVDGKKVLVK